MEGRKERKKEGRKDRREGGKEGRTAHLVLNKPINNN